MTPEFTKNGISIQTFSEIMDGLISEYQNIYGETIDLSQNTPDGQKLGIEAKLSLDLQSFALSLYQQLDPDFSEGESLNKIAKVCGITRQAATQSTVTVDVTVTQDLTLSDTFAIEDETQQQWGISEETPCTTGVNSIEFLSSEYGAFEAPADTINKVITVVLGVDSVNNPAAATPGADEETDAQFRMRRNFSFENPSYSTVGSLYAKLANLAGVTDLQVYENDQNVEDTERDMPPHSIWVVIQNGEDDEIAETMAKSKTGGTAMKGDVITNWIETRTRPDGSTFTVTHRMKYDRPTEQPLHIRLTVKRKVATVPIDLDLIKTKLKTKTYRIGEDAQASELYCYVYEAGTTFIASALEISDDGVSWTDVDIESDYDEVLTISGDNITITEEV